MIQGRKNKIEGIFDDIGAWIECKEGIQKVIEDYFNSLFYDDSSIVFPSSLPNLFPSTDPGLLDYLNDPITLEEIKEALFLIGGLNAPRPKGLSTVFLERLWDKCQNDITILIVHCFDNANMPKEINKTFNTFIPKIPNSTAVNQLKPISLCNTLYLVNSKILHG